LRAHQLVWLALCLPLLPACHKRPPAVAETPPPMQSPNVSPTVALRPTYDLKGRPITAGTGFLVRDKSGKTYYLTAVHVMDETEWRQVASVSLSTMGGEVVGNLQPPALVHVGVAFDKASAASDLVIVQAPVEKGTPVPIGTEDPKRNEWVWVAGMEMGRRGSGRLFRCTVIDGDSNGITLKQFDEFDLRGFSGAPVLNAKGEVVGILLGGKSTTVLCSKTSVLRQRIAQAGIQLP
jgi:S1-C subfamily serine protease